MSVGRVFVFTLSNERSKEERSKDEKIREKSTLEKYFGAE